MRGRVTGRNEDAGGGGRQEDGRGEWNLTWVDGVKVKKSPGEDRVGCFPNSTQQDKDLIYTSGLCEDFW